MNKVLIPTKVIEKIDNYMNIESEISILTTKQKAKIKRTLITIWFFIYNEQINSDKETLNLYVNIKGKKLGKLFYAYAGSKKIGYNTLLNWLSNADLVDCNEKYLAGEFSKAYKINTSFLQESKYTEVEIDFQKVFHNFKDKSYWIAKYPQHTNLINDAYSTLINLDEYIHWMNENAGIKLKPIFNNGKMQQRFLTPGRIYTHINLALKLNFQNLWFKLSDEGRFYSTISNLPYTSMPFLRMDRRELVDIDIKNSQPLLLSTLIDRDKYKNDVQDGVFYDKIANELGIERNEFKILSYKYIFFSDKKLKSGAVFNAMQAVYPELIHQINALKDEFRLAIKLQQMEAKIFVETLGKLGIKKLLRHDQVLVFKEDLEIVKQFLLNEYKKIGLSINLD